MIRYATLSLNIAHHYYYTDGFHIHLKKKHFIVIFSDTLHGWSIAILQFLGVSERYSRSLAKRLFKSAHGDITPALDYFKDELDNFIVKDKMSRKAAREAKLRPAIKLK